MSSRAAQRLAIAIVAVLIGVVLLVASSGAFIHAISTSVTRGLFAGSFRRSRFPGYVAPAPAVDARVHSICEFCECRTEYASHWWEPKPRLPDRLKPSPHIRTSTDLGEHMRSAVLEALCPHVHIKDPAIVLKLLHADPTTTMAWDVARLTPHKPTLFAFTKAAPFGSKVDGDIRWAYFDRHVQTILRHRELVERNGYTDGVPGDRRQVLWIIAEDNDVVDQNIVDLLSSSGINFLYFAFGPTRSWGNAQHNAVLTVIHALTNPHRPVLGHGPIFSQDDDAEIHEDLYDLVWHIRRVGVWPMGNLGPTGFEGPTWDESGTQILSWDVPDDPTRRRKFPIDNGAFALNSSLLNNGIRGPAFWPEDTNGGETEFLETFLDGWQDLERVCSPCHVAWHNQPIEISTLWLKGIPYPF